MSRNFYLNSHHLFLWLAGLVPSPGPVGWSGGMEILEALHFQVLVYFILYMEYRLTYGSLSYDAVSILTFK
jgi:hypothetical protein